MIKNKIYIAAISLLLCTTILCATLFEIQIHKNKDKQIGNYTDEMKLPHTANLNDDGANIKERQGDHVSSTYYYNVDFYNATSTDSMFILSNFKTIQQTSWWSCGVCSTMMVLNYYNKLDDYNEATLAALRSDHSDRHIGTCLDQMIEMLNSVGGFELETTYDYADNLDAIDMQWFRMHIADGIPILIGWNEWGGHWQVAIGYDTMGTEDESDDVLIVADSYDTTDHNQDGYCVYSMDRFISNFTFYDFFPENEQADKCFIAVTLAD